MKQRAALARANAARAKTPATRRHARQRASVAQRALRQIETREEFWSKLDARDRGTFDRLSIARQDQLLKVMREYPARVPRDIPDPFIGSQREPLWRLHYSSRSGLRLRAVA